MFLAAARALAEFTPATSGAGAPLLPPLEDIVVVSRRVALAVAEQARSEGIIADATPEELRRRIEGRWWTSRYRRLRRRR
jgi:malate dehydrogenase (oxaloacetate-decarboxylating)